MFAQSGQRLIGRLFDALYVAGGRYAVYDQSRYVEAHRTPEKRATGFDWTLYQVMVSDQARVGAYRKDIEARVAGRTVLEVGPGPHAALTIIAAEAGAASILSIEANGWAAEEARRRVRRFGDRVRIVAGHTTRGSKGRGTSTSFSSSATTPSPARNGWSRRSARFAAAGGPSTR